MSKKKNRSDAGTPTAVIVEDEPRVTTTEAIAELAYSYWQARGYQGGSPQEDWFRAEEELTNRASTRSDEPESLAALP